MNLYGAPIRALLAEVDAADDVRAVLEDLDVMLVVCDSWFALSRSAFHHANRLLLADADAPQARAWCAFLREFAVVDAVRKLEVEAEWLLEDVPPGGYDVG